MKFRDRFLALLIALAMPLAAAAQAYPSKPVRLIVPFPAGGPADLFGRFLAQGMSAQLGQQVVIENVSGVGGVLGVERAARSAPDGYTLVLNSSSTERAVWQGERGVDALVTGGIRGLSRPGTAQVGRGGEGDRLQGRVAPTVTKSYPSPGGKR